MRGNRVIYWGSNWLQISLFHCVSGVCSLKPRLVIGKSLGCSQECFSRVKEKSGRTGKYEFVDRLPNWTLPSRIWIDILRRLQYVTDFEQITSLDLVSLVIVHFCVTVRFSRFSQGSILGCLVTPSLVKRLFPLFNWSFILF